ncbi:MAG: 1-acyl-sn-glycerol-3-phosphate acyltransferase [Spirochaetes bacterium]|nr:1-acyl-sn-glycerol-3-phosphate acyltransferase [Spirochaetota bacterium]
MLISWMIDFIISVYFYECLVLAAITGCIISIPLKLFKKSRHIINHILSFYGSSLLSLSGCRLKITGKAIPEQNFLIAADHKSTFDILVLKRLLRGHQFRWIIKSSLFQLPFFGPLIVNAGYIRMDRKNKYRAYAAIQKAIDVLKTEASIIIFPEGTRSTTEEILPFKSGSIKIAFSSGVDILPVVIKNTLQINRRGNFMIHPQPILVEILEPIKIKGKNFSGQQQQKILQNLRKQITDKYNKLA